MEQSHTGLVNSEKTLDPLPPKDRTLCVLGCGMFSHLFSLHEGSNIPSSPLAVLILLSPKVPLV